MSVPAAPATIRWNFARGALAALLCAGGLVVGATEHSSAGAPGQHPVSGFAGTKWGDPQADATTLTSAGVYNAAQDPGSLFNVEKAIGARALWGKKDALGRPVTGQGVGVAVLDSGVDQVGSLAGLGKVTYGPDLSIEENGVLTDKDTFGHGTFMAGIIAGRGTLNPSSTLASAPASVQLGVAPDAKVLALKLATTDGSTDVSQVIASLDWVVEHPVMPDGTRIRVINLSYGTDSTQRYQDDPLAAAAENAWKHGIVVVVSAGNEGNDADTLTDPATDPFVIAAGAADSSNQLNGWQAKHTQVADFSQASATRGPDLIAPGRSIVSQRDPGSYVDANYPTGRVDGDATDSLFRGSGTSQAAAVTTGAVADLLQAFPTLTPDQVKYALTSTADPIAGQDPDATGAGILDLDGAYNALKSLSSPAQQAAAAAAATQDFPAATGQGSLDAARGGTALLDADGMPLVGEVDAQGNAWDAAAWWQASSSLTAWSGGQWMGATWTGSGWAPNADPLASARWSSARWSSARWSDADWSSARWSSARWSSARWSSARWSSARWSSNGW